MSCEYKEKVLNILKNDILDSEIEAHIEQCPACSAMVEGYLERGRELLPTIPQTEYTGPDHRLKTGVIKYNRGRNRIIAFTIIGLIMGWLSFQYTRDPFIVTKIIMAIPYKISEAIYATLHSIPYAYRMSCVGMMNEYFPQSQLITLLAERFTPVLIGGAMYGSIGFFTGDKRIFTLNKYLKFAFVWCCVILLWIGAVFAGNAIAVRKNSNLEDIRGFFLNAETHGSSFYDDDTSNAYDTLRNALGDVTLLKDIKDYRITDTQTVVEIRMGIGRCNLTVVNWEENYMIMDMGRVVSIPVEFSALIKDYYEGTGIFNGQNGAVSVEAVKVEAAEEEEEVDNEIAD